MEPFFSAFGVNWELLTAQAINFVIVLIALRAFLYKPVMAMLERRRAIVQKGLADAAAAERVFADADEEVSKRLRTADEQAERAFTEGRAAAAAERARLVQEAEKRAGAIEREADARAAETAARARAESEREVARLATLAAARVLKEYHD